MATYKINRQPSRSRAFLSAQTRTQDSIYTHQCVARPPSHTASLTASHIPSTMSVAIGLFIVADGQKFTSTFTWNNVVYNFNGTLNQAVPPFSSYGTALTFGTPAELFGNHNFVGSVGPDVLDITITNPVGQQTIKGALTPGIPGKFNLTGSGSWGHN